MKIQSDYHKVKTGRIHLRKEIRAIIRKKSSGSIDRIKREVN